MGLLSDLNHLTSNTIFPWRCLLCGLGQTAVCHECLETLTVKSQQLCLACLKPSLDGLTHLSCQTKYMPVATFSLLDYKDQKVAELIISGKYRFYKDIFKILGHHLSGSLEHVSWFKHLKPENTVIVPLPLHDSRARWRGFNQSGLLSQAVAHNFHFAISQTLKRTKRTRTQKNLDLEHRQKNVAEAFNIRPTNHRWWQRFIELEPTNKTEQNIDTYTIVDDVRTTGSTLLAACRALVSQKKAKIYCITLAAD